MRKCVQDDRTHPIRQMCTLHSQAQPQAEAVKITSWGPWNTAAAPASKLSLKEIQEQEAREAAKKQAAAASASIEAATATPAPAPAPAPASAPAPAPAPIPLDRSADFPALWSNAPAAAAPVAAKSTLPAVGRGKSLVKSGTNAPAATAVPGVPASANASARPPSKPSLADILKEQELEKARIAKAAPVRKEEVRCAQANTLLGERRTHVSGSQTVKQPIGSAWGGRKGPAAPAAPVATPTTKAAAVPKAAATVAAPATTPADDDMFWSIPTTATPAAAPAASTFPTLSGSASTAAPVDDSKKKRQRNKKGRGAGAPTVEQQQAWVAAQLRALNASDGMRPELVNALRRSSSSVVLPLTRLACRGVVCSRGFARACLTDATIVKYLSSLRVPEDIKDYVYGTVGISSASNTFIEEFCERLNVLPPVLSAPPPPTTKAASAQPQAAPTISTPASSATASSAATTTPGKSNKKSKKAKGQKVHPSLLFQFSVDSKGRELETAD